MLTGILAISGVTGFIGRHLAGSLLSAGHRLLVMVRADSDRSRIPHAPGRVLVVDVADLGRADVREQLARCDAWINAATAYGRGDPEDTERVRAANIDYPCRILDAVIEAGCARVLHFDSFFAREDLEHDYLPTYTATKKEFVRRARLRVAGTGTSFFNLRLEHVYGPLDDRKKFVPWLLTQLLQNQARIPLTAGVQERDFVFVDDVVSATQAVLERAPDAPGCVTTIALGTGTMTSIRRFATLAKEVAASSSELDFGVVQPTGRGIEASCADTTFLRSLGWKVGISLAEGISRTLADIRAESADDPAVSVSR